MLRTVFSRFCFLWAGHLAQSDYYELWIRLVGGVMVIVAIFLVALMVYGVKGS